jgi:hypothetical protein
MKQFGSLAEAHSAGYEVYDRNQDGYVVARWSADVRPDGTRTFELARAPYDRPSIINNAALEAMRALLPPGHPLKGDSPDTRYGL